MARRLRQFVTSGDGAPPLHVSFIAASFIKIEGPVRELAARGFDLARLEFRPSTRGPYDNADLVLSLRELVRLDVPFAENLKVMDTASGFMSALQERGHLDQPFLSLSWPGTGSWVIYRNFYNVAPAEVLGQGGGSATA